MPGIESPNNGGDSPSQGQKKFTEITEKIKGRSLQMFTSVHIMIN